MVSIAKIGVIASSIVQYIYVLDAYPNASAAFSVRKLRSTYAGYCMRVRRDSDDTEQDIGFVNNILDITSLLTFVVGNSGFVVAWYDQSGNGYNVTQATSSKQPRVVASGALEVENGLPTLNWNIGANQYLNANLAANWKFLSDPSGFSVYSVISLDATTTVLWGTNTVGTSADIGYFFKYINGSNDLQSVNSNGATFSMFINYLLN